MFFKIAPFLIALFMFSFLKINWSTLKDKPLIIALLITGTITVIIGIRLLADIPLESY